jgi:hypothetical protein
MHLLILCNLNLALLIEKERRNMTFDANVWDFKSLRLFAQLVVNGEQVLNMLCCWVEDPNSEAYKCHLARINDYLWVAEDGMKMQVP